MRLMSALCMTMALRSCISLTSMRKLCVCGTHSISPLSSLRGRTEKVRRRSRRVRLLPSLRSSRLTTEANSIMRLFFRMSPRTSFLQRKR